MADNDHSMEDTDGPVPQSPPLELPSPRSAALGASPSAGAPSAMGGAASSLPQSSIPPGSPSRSGMPLSFGGTAGTPYSTPFGTRGDMGYSHPNRRRSMSAFTPGGSEGAQSDDMDAEVVTTLFHGSNINVASVQSRFRRFLRNFGTDRDDGEAKYLALIIETVRKGDAVLNLDCTNVYEFDRQLYQMLTTHPTETIPIFDTEVNRIAEELMLEGHLEIPLQVRTFNLQEIKVIRDLNPSDINQLIAVSGMVTRASNIIPDMRMALFKCQQCGTEETVYNERGRVKEPERCLNDNCGGRFTMQVIHNRCAFNNKQLVKMQENPNAIPEGETPNGVTLFAFDELVDCAKPGDRVTVTGVFKASAMRVSPRLTSLKSVFKTYIDVVHVQKDEASKMFSLAGTIDSQGEPLAQPTEPSEPTESQPEGEQPFVATGDETAHVLKRKQDELEALAADPNIYEKLAASIAPSIWQLEDVKKGILCQLFGATTKEFTGGRVRGEINVLLVGDPGVSKSQLLGYVHKLAPRGIYTSGRGSSAVGLTAYVAKDPETREMVLESGALVLSDRGICCIDEFDKMSESARSMLHEVMEQQTVSVAKAGIISTLNARTSVLASANPVGSRFNPRLSIIDNIQLPPTLLSRFDLIYLVLDKPNEATDRRLARHLISLFHDTPPESSQAIIPADTLKDYIAFSRARCHPVITAAAGEALIKGYLEMRAAGISRKVITATPRQLESAIRLSESLARMRLAAQVELTDVAEALRLMKVAMQQSATDPTTGLIDMDVITTGVSAADRVARTQLARELKDLIDQQSGQTTIASLTQLIAAQSSIAVEESDIKTALLTIQDEVNINWNHGTVSARL